ncbi:MAG: hypothetical protein ACRD16_00605 [Thermoanaerobaculia bacterium]
MRIGEFRREIVGPVVRLAATIEWEDCGFTAEELCFEVEGADPGEVVASPETLAVRAALAALHQKERRVLVEGALCPRLRDGLRAALRTVKGWYSLGHEAPVIEASRGFRALTPPSPHAALFLSGGADSLFVLQSNRAAYPPDHPSSFRTAVFEPNFGARLEAVASPRVRNLLSRQRVSISEIARRTGLRLVSARAFGTELREDPAFTASSSHGARLAAPAHLLSALSSISIAASFDATDLHPWGSHPLLDSNYSSSSLEVRHEAYGFDRLERVASVSEWKEILPFLLVCSQGPLESGQTNCGRCEKCLRTMIELLLANALSEDGPFRARDVEAGLLEGLVVAPESLGHWEGFPGLLRRAGRAELARLADALIAGSRRSRDWAEDRGWKGALRRLDRRLLGSRLLETRRRISSNSS